MGDAVDDHAEQHQMDDLFALDPCMLLLVLLLFTAPDRSYTIFSIINRSTLHSSQLASLP